MRAVVQRVRSARVMVDQRVVGAIETGLLVLVGVAPDDGPDDLKFMTGKLPELRIFDDEQGRMNRSVRDVGGSVLVVSQFTLYGDCRKGRRPSFDAAAPADFARQMYEALARMLAEGGLRVETGAFQARMAVELVNDGPVTLLLDSRRAF
jgi:D-tyrosyl-tRNA(Tyr) deacylase